MRGAAIEDLHTQGTAAIEGEREGGRKGRIPCKGVGMGRIQFLVEKFRKMEGYGQKSTSPSKAYIY
ncbi:hypothetical protein [Candidatus Cardinium hertigii]|uniref:hypothetical protein n=1 Tax=Candidatus Cardinium hertigii TaxID=247481 RepID=UPI000D708816|nr:hypothetical protein [Candidatus Cardinium hertigii]